MSKDVIIGIDLGTTNSLVAVADEKGVRVLKDGESPLIPSVVVFDEEGHVQAVGQRAKTLKSIDPKRVIYSIKRLMGKGKQDLARLPFQLPFDLSESTDAMIRIKAGNHLYTPIELSAKILERCKSVAENALGFAVTKAVITVPAYFNEAERSATEMAGRLAGLKVMRIINEPTAAALAFGVEKREGPQTIAVYDFGGGTFDISILKMTNGIFEVLSTHGDTQLGGDDLDHALSRLMIKKIGEGPKSEEDEILFLGQVENLKKSLTDSESIDATIHWGGSVRWKGRLEREEVSTVLRPIIHRTIEACETAVHLSAIPKSSITEVIMVGGSSRIPLVQKMVSNFFEKSVNTSLNPDEAVALGAAIQASILAGEVKDTLLLDVVPLSLGLETMGGVVSKVIPRNSTLPIAAAEMFTTYADNQTAVDLHILQGERELVRDCRSLGKFKLRLLPAPAGLPKIQVTFLMDVNGMLRVKAVDQLTGEAATLEVRPSFGLTDAEVESMLEDAWNNAQKDFAERQMIEARNQATTLIRATEKSLKNPLLDQEFKNEQEIKLRPTLNALTEDLKSASLEVVVVRTKELDLLTQALAETILNRSVQARLSHQLEAFS